MNHLNRPFSTGLLDTMFDDFFRPLATRKDVTNGKATLRSWVPSLNVTETSEAYTVEVELPGIDPTQVELTFEDGVLAISGEKQHKKVEDEDTVHRVERSYGRFSRKLAFPHAVEGDKIQAQAEHGVLTIAVPKAARARPLKIQVQGGAPKTLETQAEGETPQVD